MSEELSFYEKIIDIQKRLKAPKTLRNSYAEFNYRSAEGIEAAVKPLLFEHNLLMIITDDFVPLDNQTDPGHVKATVEITDGKTKAQTSAFARETKERKKSDSSQLTGAASSYARKYALCGMFLIDDTKDADSYEEPENVVSVKRDPTKYGTPDAKYDGGVYTEPAPSRKQEPTGFINEKARMIVLKEILDAKLSEEQNSQLKDWMSEKKLTLLDPTNVTDGDLEGIYNKLSELIEPI